MWCMKCQADVAAEMAPDNRRLLCASCGSQVRTVPLSPTEDKTRQARELLERWSKNRWSEPAEDPPEPVPAALPNLREPQPGPSARIPPNSTFRVDEPHPDRGTATESSKETRQSASAAGFSQPVETPSETFPQFPSRTHHPHEASAPPPHFPAEPLPEDFSDAAPAQRSSSNLQVFWGQMLAYAGVLALTIGAVFVLLGYFGGPEWQSYTPTGWLMTTTGQMLLFLGVVTLVSGGMEQTTEEVARRIDKLGQRIIRIEWAAGNHALKGPSLPAEQFQTNAEGQNSGQTIGPSETQRIS